MAELPSLEKIVEQVVGRKLSNRNYPKKLSPETVRQFHDEIHLHYHRLGRIERLAKGEIKVAVRAYLEQQHYWYIEQWTDDPRRPGKGIFIDAHYELRKES